MKINFQVKDIYKFGYLVLALTATFWLISFFEVYQLTYKNINISIGSTLFFKLINDFWTAIILGLLLFPIYFLITYFHKKTGLIFIQIAFVIIIIS